TTVTAHESIAHDTGQIPHCADTGADGGSLAEQPPGSGLTLLAHAVTRRHVTDLMPQHGSQLCLGVEIGKQATMDIDVAARQREGIDVRTVDQGEDVVELVAMAAARYPLAHALYIGLQLGVFVARVLLEDFLV